MAKLRSISTSIWSDPFIEDLSPTEKLLFIYLITNEKTNMLGIYESSIKKISFETGIDKPTIEKALKGFETLGKVKRIGNWIVLVNYMKHQNYNLNMKKSAIDAYNSLPKELKNSKIDVSKNNPSEGFETLLNHYGMVRKIEYEYEEEYEEEIKDSLIDFDKFVSFFNSLENLPRINTLTPKRKKSLKARIKDHGKDDVVKAFKAANTNKFTSGNNSTGWKANFDWIVKPDNMLKLLEGNYSDGSKPQNQQAEVKKYKDI